jgi:prevent-host-death family protein
MSAHLYSKAMDVSVTDLRANLAAFLDRVRAGDEITITDRGEPIARVVPAGWAQRLS